VSEPVVRDSGVWVAKFVIKKFDGDSAFDPDAEPYEVVETGNQVANGGISCLWECLLGNGTATAGQSLTYFSNTNAAIGVGDSNAAFAATQNDLQAASSKLRVGMNATYPQHTDGTGSGATSILFQSTFGTSQANWAWEEIAAFNSPTAATGRMLNRRVQSLGTKTSSSSWQAALTVSITP
jgi:hypothetical protein